MSNATPDVRGCPTAEHLDTCGECADQIESIVKDVLTSQEGKVSTTKLVAYLPAPSEEQAGDEQPVSEEPQLSGLLISHADVPNAVDHPVEYKDKCGICVTQKRKGARGGADTPAAVVSQLEQL